MPGFFLAVGFGGHGFQHSPMTGRMVAEWIVDGKPSMNLSLFDPGRFGDQCRIPTLIEVFDLHRKHAGLLHLDIAASISNHREFYQLAASYNVPFHHIPVTAATKAQAFALGANDYFLKPMDLAMLESLTQQHRILVTVEEGTIVNGFGAYLAETLQTTHPEVRVVALGVPDRLIEQAPRAEQLESFGLTAAGIARRIGALQHEETLEAR